MTGERCEARGGGIVCSGLRVLPSGKQLRCHGQRALRLTQPLKAYRLISSPPCLTNNAAQDTAALTPMVLALVQAKADPPTAVVLGDVMFIIQERFGNPCASLGLNNSDSLSWEVI
jgi:hypothetical protein